MPPPLPSSKPFLKPSQETLKKLYRAPPPPSSRPSLTSPSSTSAPSLFYNPTAKPPPSLSSLLITPKAKQKVNATKQEQPKHIFTSQATPMLKTVRRLTGITAITSPLLALGSNAGWIQAAIVIPNVLIAAILHIASRTFVTKMEIVKQDHTQFDTERTDRLIRFTLFPQTRQITIPRSYLTATGHRFQNIAIKEKYVEEMKSRGWNASKYFMLDVTSKLEDEKWKDFVMDLPSRVEK